ncbi:aldehyde dehydrogenase family protein [Methylomarinum sp. Ch1-1]|uniref:Aldehyde dehydrogenase family protein n=1 Tax=Methylomarinum roseum TaxID=3067653 RepID=A0AAU7NYU4_9GAMM|nr:aldehyde dehydrogenase family protein [Methylomarinum sp. Ch1-1]MDP4521759.1 aldehyde dehydrogenase family protein [Methylomarinum sp. Ch1-1]
MSAFEHYHPSQYSPYIGGHFQLTPHALDVFSPYSGKPVYKTYLAGPDEFEIALQAACSAKTVMQDFPVYHRYRVLMQIAEAISAHREQFATIMAREAGKPLKTAFVEIDRAVQTFQIAAEEAKRLPGELLSIDWHPSGAGKDAIVKYFPIGIVAAITPFNFPLNLVAHKIAPAIAAGCPIVLKPASKTPISALLLAKIIDQTDLPTGALSVLPMDRQTGNQLVTDERFDLLSFTGSSEVGWEMKQRAGKKRVVLELGGNAALVVDQDADLQTAVAKAVKGGFGYAGQSCIHTQRIYVEASRFDDFVALFRDRINDLVIGDPESAETDMSVMINEQHATRIEAWVNEAVAAGATLIAGGNRDCALYAPTVLTNTDKQMKICAQEAFAPVVVIEPFSDFKQAIAAVNDSEFGLQAGIFTFDSRKIYYAFHHLRVGGVIINETPTFRADHMPYGGIKDSGLGREGPRYALLDMLEPKVLVMDHNQTL